MNAFRQKDMPHDQQAAKCDRRRSLRPIFRNRGLRANDGTCNDDRNASSRRDLFRFDAVFRHADEG